MRKVFSYKIIDSEAISQPWERFGNEETRCKNGWNKIQANLVVKLEFAFASA